MWGFDGAQPKPHKQLLKQSSSFVLGSLQTSKYLASACGRRPIVDAAYGPQRMPKRSATLVLSFGTGGERVMWCRFTMRVVEKAILGPT